MLRNLTETPSIVDAESDQELLAGDPRFTFLHLFAHDVRWSLRGAMEATSALPTVGNLTGDQAHLVERVSSCLAHVQDLMADLIDVDRLQEDGDVGHTERFEVAGVVLSSIGDVVFAGHELHVDVPVESAPVMADPVLVKRGLLKLLGNAIAHTPLGTTVWVRVDVTQDRVIVSVEDDGPGVPDEAKERIFALFERRVANHSAGLGLGLPLVRRIARLHGGDVWVEDRPGGGAAFRFVLPIVPVANAARSSA